LGQTAVNPLVARASIEDGGFDCVSELYKGLIYNAVTNFQKIGPDVCGVEKNSASPNLLAPSMAFVFSHSYFLLFT